MSDERKIAEKMIEDGKKMVEEAQEKLKALKTTYRFGDRFLSGGGTKAILAAVGNSEVMMINLNDGGRWGNTRTKVKDIWNITQEEFTRIYLGSGNFVRYWDGSKKQHAGERAKQEKLEEFELSETPDEYASKTYIKDNRVVFGIVYDDQGLESSDASFSISLDDFPDFVANLQKMVVHVKELL